MSESEPQFCPTPPPAAPAQDRRQMLGCLQGSLAHQRWRPIALTGLFRQLLITHFSAPDNIEEPDLREAIWQEGDKTGILVESVHRWLGGSVEKRPAVVIKRNAMRNVRLTINDMAKVDQRGFEHFVTLWTGSHSLFCINGTGAGTELLATEVQRELTQFGPAIRTGLGLQKYQVLDVGEIGELEESTQNYVIPIVVGWAYQETWQLRSDALTLMGVTLSLSVHDC